jgi:hypothetical protein
VTRLTALTATTADIVDVICEIFGRPSPFLRPMLRLGAGSHALTITAPLAGMARPDPDFSKICLTPVEGDLTVLSVVVQLV